MKTPKLRPLKSPMIGHAVADVAAEVADVGEARMLLAKRLHAASGLLRQPVGQSVTMMISKTTIWIRMRN